jgi:EpsI family protein
VTARVPYLIALATIIAAALLYNGIGVDQTVVLPQHLAALPLNLASWEGETDYFEPGIIAQLGLADYILRRYRDPAGKILWLYAGYWGSQQVTGSRIHSPAVCLPGAGWVIVNSRIMPIRLSDRTIMVNGDVIQKDDQRQLVLYWYQIHGRVVATELRAVTLLAWTALTQRRSDEALVRINTPIVGSPQDTLQLAVAFVQTAFPPLARLLSEPIPARQAQR